MNDRTALLDIAEYCNLSKSTVSRVLNGNAGNFRIATETVEKVLHTAKKLNYRPNRLARAINARRTHLIGISFSKYAADDIDKERQLANNHRIMGGRLSAITQHPLSGMPSRHSGLKTTRTLPASSARMKMSSQSSSGTVHPRINRKIRTNLTFYSYPPLY